MTTRCVGAVLVRDGKVLLGLRRVRPGRSHAGTWDVIGGHVEPGESEEQALRRELAEELGIEPSAYRKLVVLLDPPDAAAPVLALHLFVVSAWRGELDNSGGEHSELAWHHPTALSQLPLATPLYVQWLPRALDG